MAPNEEQQGGVHLKRVPSHAAVAVAALAVGAAGTAGAAVLIDSGDIKNKSLKPQDFSKKAKKALRGKQGPTGPAGPLGADGSVGATGAPGAAGPLILRLSSLSFPVRYHSILGLGGEAPSVPSPAVDISNIRGGIAANSATESNVSIPLPGGLVATGLDVYATGHDKSPTGALTISVRKNSAPTELGCSIDWPGGGVGNPVIGDCSDTGSVPVAAGDSIAIESTNPSSSGAGLATVALRLEPAS